MTDWALELAENPNTCVPLRPGHERIVGDRYVLWLGSGDHPAWTVAQRFRFSADELANVRAELHDHVRARGKTALSWEVGSSATPVDARWRTLLRVARPWRSPTPAASHDRSSRGSASVRSARSEP
jgi:hypothetical protein